MISKDSKSFKIGIDYSITSPAICIWNQKDKFEFKNLSFYYATEKKKLIGKIRPNIIGLEYPSQWKTNTERFEKLSELFLSCFPKNSNIICNIEDYSMGSKGLVFNLAENTGLLKHKLYKQNIPFNLVAPSANKKKATGKGNSDKNVMLNQWNKETEINLFNVFGFSEELLKIPSPITDIVDSYFLCKF